MNYGLAAWGMREMSLDEQIALAKKLGGNFVELSIANTPNDPLQLDSTPEQIEAVRQAFLRAGLSTDVTCTGNDFTGGDVDEQVKKVKRVIDIAHAFGARFIRMFAGFNSDSVVIDDCFQRMLDALKDVADYAAQYGITLCAETHGGVHVTPSGAFIHVNSISTRIDAWKDILKTGVKINYDPANLAAVGCADPIAFYKLFRDDIRYIHIKDFRDVPGGVLPTICGDGRLDWPRLLSTISDYAGPIAIEYELPQDVVDGMTRSLEYMKRCLPAT